MSHVGARGYSDRPGDEDEDALLRMLEETLYVWADEARQICDDLPDVVRVGATTKGGA